MDRICPICARENHDPLPIGVVEHIWQTPKNVYLCTHCSAYFIDMPAPEELTDLYRNSYHDRSRNPLFAFAKSKMRQARSLSQYRWLAPHLASEIRHICEIGAYDATLLALFKKEGFAVSGFEANDYARACAQRRYGICMERDFFLDDSRCDLVVLSHVLEHFIDPCGTLLAIKARLHPGGMVYIEVPRSPMPDECGPAMLRQYLNTTHTVNFTAENLALLVRRAGLNIVSVQHNTYRLENRHAPAAETLSISLLAGTLPPAALLPRFIGFAMRTLWAPGHCFTDYPVTGSPWLYAENIRLLARLP